MKFNYLPAYCLAKKLEIEKTEPLFNPGYGTYIPKKLPFIFQPGKSAQSLV